MAAEPERRFVTDFFPTHVGGENREGRPSSDGSATEDALLILNYHLPKVTSHVWQRVPANRRVCADGGANRLYDELPKLLAANEDFSNGGEASAFASEAKRHAFASAVREAHVPHAIVGDLDSVRPEVLAFYQKRGCLTVDMSHDQDTTDLHKAVTWLERVAHTDARLEEFYEREDAATQNRRRRVLVVGALGGRFDHEMAHVSCLHAFADTEIVLVGRTSTARLIPKGTTTIVPDANAEGPTCGLIPLLGPATVSTSGLRWNLNNQALMFGTLISTSNMIRGYDDEAYVSDEDAEDDETATREKKKTSSPSGEVRVRTDAPLVWTTDVTRARGL